MKQTNEIRKEILQMVYKAGEGHIPSAFSVVEILFSLYSHLGPDDVFFLSKGHASAAFYAVLAYFGILDKRELETFCRYDSLLGGHPHRKEALIMNSSGSLGHGFPIAAGFALAKKIKKEPGRVFTLIGDGEANEGSVWEAAMHAQQLKLDNLVCIVDDNKSQGRAMVSINLKDKFEAFGWAAEAVDGHNIEEISGVLFNNKAQRAGKPFCVVADTVKGKGIKELEENYLAWHHRAPTETELASFLKELEL